MTKTDPERSIHDLLLLRFLAAAIGEQTNPPWWRTNFLSSLGLRTTARLFPRTALPAALKSVSAAACMDHDTRIGVGGHCHLFRLPQPVEQSLAAAASDEALHSEFAKLAQEGQKALIKRLEDIAAGRRADPAEGPVRLGPAKDIGAPDSIARMAAHYLASIAYGIRRFPYFEAPEGGR
jgi:hypothetical protein